VRDAAWREGEHLSRIRLGQLRRSVHLMSQLKGAALGTRFTNTTSVLNAGLRAWYNSCKCGLASHEIGRRVQLWSREANGG
jgi:hypothetical protein